MRVGVIDCGTNTFNILIAEFHNGGHEILFSTKIAVKLAPSVDTNMIGSNRFGRGLDALLVHKNILENYQTERVYLFATSAIRDSANGKEFVKQVKEALNFDIHVIGGDEEAELIYEGVIQDIQLEEDVDLIMDIGGGSVEFILAHVHGILWKRSFPIGVSRLKGMFMPSDPMTEEESGKIQEFLFGALEPLFEEIGKHQPKRLIGSSGSFDSIIDMLASGRSPLKPSPTGGLIIPLGRYSELSQQLQYSTLEERLNLPGLIPMRADMIVLAFMLINSVLEHSHIPLSEIIHTRFALKEGALARIEREIQLLE